MEKNTISRSEHRTKKEEPLIKVRNLKKYFHTPGGQLHAVDDVSFDVFPGTTLGVVGESGCGKSTLGRTLIRLTDATAGEVFFKGQSVIKAEKDELKQMRRKMQIIFQDPYASLNPRLTISEIISDPLKVNKVYSDKNTLQAEVEQLMDTVGLARRLINSYPHELDGGRRQRVGIARALALQPDFIVCDEPVSALDVSIQAQILNLLMDLQDEKDLTFLFITHDLSVVKHISDEIIVMYLGQCVERAKSKELFANPKHPYTQGLLAAIPIPSIEQRNRQVQLLEGELSSPINPKPGCRFASRCPHFREECMGKDIEEISISDTHKVSCVLYR